MPNPELLFRALADGTRRKLLRVLLAHELSVSELVEVLEQPQSTVSRHLKVLRDAGMVTERRQGTAVLSVAQIPVATLDSTSSGGNTNGRNGTGLRDRLLEWAAHEPMDEELQTRLQRVLRRRQSANPDFFETLGDRWDQLRIDAFGNMFHLEAMTALLPSEWIVADIGTGTGYLLPILAARFRRVIAVEPAGAMLDAARNRPAVKSLRNVAFRVGSLDNLPIQTAEVDLAITSLVLHHVESPAEALQEVSRVVKPGGRLLIIEQSVHDNPDFSDRMGDRWRGFGPDVLKTWVRDAGFKEPRPMPLTTARGSAKSQEQIPELFVMTAERAGPSSGRLSLERGTNKGGKKTRVAKN